MSSGLTVVQLRAELRKRNLDTKGLKVDLIARLDDAIAGGGGDGGDGDGEAAKISPKKGKRKAAEAAAEEEEEAEEEDPLPAAKRSKLGEVMKMTVVQLSKELRERNLDTKGRKKDLLERLIAALDDDDNKASGSGDDKASDDKDKDAKDDKNDATKASVVDNNKTDNQSPEKSRASSRVKAKENKKEETALMVKSVKKGRAVLDDELPAHIRASFHVLEEGDNVWDAMLNQTNIGSNNNKFYKLQVLEADDNSRYHTWLRWGRVGYKGAVQLHGGSREDCKRMFENKFRLKSKNSWGDRRNFVAHHGKYTLLEMDYEADDDEAEKKAAQKKAKKKEPAMKKQVQSKLDSRVESFVSMICDLKMMKQQMVEIGYDARKMPLGKLSKATILKGYETLKAIQAVLETRSNAQSLLDLSSQFFTLIPHDFGFKDIRNQTINSVHKLKEKIAMVEALGEIAIATQVLQEEADEDDPAFSHYRSLRCGLLPLDQDDDEFKMVHDYLKNTHGKTHQGYDLNVTNVFRAQRDGEDASFQSFNQTPNRMLLWHGSRLTNWTGILSQGLRIAPPEAPSTGYMFGKGVYFADMVSKSANYCFTSPQNPQGVLLLCEVALGEMNELYHADYNASNLPPGKLSTKGLGRTVPNDSQAQTMPDGVVVPLGKPTTSKSQNTSLEYNEYIVYSTNQIRMRYALQVEFQYKKLGGYY